MTVHAHDHRPATRAETSADIAPQRPLGPGGLASAAQADELRAVQVKGDGDGEAIEKALAASGLGDADLGFGSVSLRSYIRQDKEPRRSAMWREDMAAWQRKAVESGPKGAEIQRAATDDGGLTLGRARVGDIVRDDVEAHPEATDEEIVAHAARRHDPGSRNHPGDVVRIWREQSKSRAEEAAEAPEAAAPAELEATE